MLDKNIIFYFQVALFKIIISNDRLKHRTEIIHVRYEEDYFVMNSMEQVSSIFEIPCNKKISG